MGTWPDGRETAGAIKGASLPITPPRQTNLMELHTVKVLVTAAPQKILELMHSRKGRGFFLFMLFLWNLEKSRTEKAMASANAVDMDAGAMASWKKVARKPKPATNGLGSDEVERWGK